MCVGGGGGGGLMSTPPSGGPGSPLWTTERRLGLVGLMNLQIQLLWQTHDQRNHKLATELSFRFRPVPLVVWLILTTLC